LIIDSRILSSRFVGLFFGNSNHSEQHSEKSLYEVEYELDGERDDRGSTKTDLDVHSTPQSVAEMVDLSHAFYHKCALIQPPPSMKISLHV
jgi:hypothetical protein